MYQDYEANATLRWGRDLSISANEITFFPKYPLSAQTGIHSLIQYNIEFQDLKRTEYIKNGFQYTTE